MTFASNLIRRYPRVYRTLARMRFRWGSESVVTLPLGFKIISNRYSYVEQQIRFGNFENHRAVFLRNAFVENCKFIDIGANVGFFSLLAASLGCEVHSFEPDRQNAHRLMQNIAANGFQSKVQVNNIALGEMRGRLPIYAPMSDNYGRISLVKDETSVVSDTVEVNTLDSVLVAPDERVVIKIDVEGFEEQVLLGATKWLASVKKGSLWIIEVHQGQGVVLSRIMSFFPEYSLTFFDDSTGCERSLDDPPLGDPVLLARK